MSNRSGYRCAFKECCSVSSGKIGTKETLFRFPKDSEKCKLWTAACNRKELYTKDPVTLHSSYRVCKKHFTDAMFLNYEKTRLQPHAIPFSTENNIDLDDTIHMEASTSKNTNISLEEKSLEKDKDNSSGKSTKDIGIQIPLTLSRTSPRKCQIRKKLRQAGTKIKKLEIILKKKEERDDAKMNINLLDKAVDKFFPLATANFLKEQARLFQVNAKGRRYSPAFKQHCLSLYFSGPKAYRDLAVSKLFCLPNPITLKRFIRTFYLTPGIQNVAFQLLKIKIETLEEIDKHCIICLDEMSLKAHLFYNSTRDRVIGFEDIGLDNRYTEQCLPARSVAVILVRGICKSWKQPLAYFFLIPLLIVLIY